MRWFESVVDRRVVGAEKPSGLFGCQGLAEQLCLDTETRLFPGMGAETLFQFAREGAVFDYAEYPPGQPRGRPFRIAFRAVWSLGSSDLGLLSLSGSGCPLCPALQWGCCLTVMLGGPP